MLKGGLARPWAGAYCGRPESGLPHGVNHPTQIGDSAPSAIVEVVGLEQITAEQTDDESDLQSALAIVDGYEGIL